MPSPEQLQALQQLTDKQKEFFNTIPVHTGSPLVPPSEIAESCGARTPGEEPFDSACRQLRNSIKVAGSLVKQLKQHTTFKMPGVDGDKRDCGEMTANIMLAYRHLEDAAMRLGKAIQAYDGGVSVYDK